MRADRWVSTSALQKAIRRGDVHYALTAATALWTHDRQAFWRRLHVVALEDVSVANPALMVEVLTATAASLWRRKVGDLRVGLYLTRKLAESAKCRIADELFSQVERAPEHAALRNRLANEPDDVLAGYVTDERRDLIRRAMALWFIAGTKKYPSDVLPHRNGEPADAVELLRSLSAPADLVESCISVMSRTQWPLAMWTPLMWQEVQKHRYTLTVQHHALPAASDVLGVPTYAADLFTRVGGSCYRQLRAAVPELQQFSPRQIGLAMFYREGAQVYKLLTSPFLDAFKQAGEAADIEGNGMCLPSYMGLRQCLDQHTALLDEIRIEQLGRVLEDAA